MFKERSLWYLYAVMRLIWILVNAINLENLIYLYDTQLWCWKKIFVGAIVEVGRSEDV